MIINKNNKILEGKVAVITGAGRGIGKAIAMAYAEAGAAVCCAARTVSEIENTANEILNSGGRSLIVQTDVTDAAAVESLMKKTAKYFGGIDILVINAGINIKLTTVEDSEIHHWRRAFETNLFGAYYCAKYAIPHLKKSNNGKIITLGSALSHKSTQNQSAYCCSKAALWMLTRVLSQELNELNISVNELAPGSVKTRMKIRSETPLYPGQWIKSPKDVVPLALFLASQPKLGPTGQSYSLYRSPLESYI